MYLSGKCTGKCTGKVPFSVLEKLCTGKFKILVLNVLECTGIGIIVYWNVLRKMDTYIIFLANIDCGGQYRMFLMCFFANFSPAALYMN